ncbi:hypothetical protein [Streptomyces sp. NBC_01614]|uniref:hypothetical protein n=1 Tax=Streptomyces sp. NBC_01614 TaxID=2975897 RepID=UPI00386F7D84
MAATTTLPTPPTPHLASLAAALKTGDRDALAQAFAELSEEALVLGEQAPTYQLWKFWLDLSETFQHESRLHNQHAAEVAA